MAHSKKRKTGKPKRSKQSEEFNPTLPSPIKNEVLDPIKVQSPTAIVSEVLRTGVSPYKSFEIPEIPGESELKGGDPDVNILENEYSGEEIPGATMPTPDQSNVDDIGRAYGVNEEDSGELRTSEELRQRRDRHRPELQAPTKPGQL